MGMSQNLIINSKIFDFQHESGQRWQITERSRKVIAFITVDISDVEWLVNGGCLHSTDPFFGVLQDSDEWDSGSFVPTML